MQRFVHNLVQFLLRLPKFPGRDFLIVYAPKWLLPKPKGESIVKTRFGFSIYVNPKEDGAIDPFYL
jgi:hypothetical protein